jgi:hypothetical protein
LGVVGIGIGVGGRQSRNAGKSRRCHEKIVIGRRLLLPTFEGAPSSYLD